MIVMKNDKIMIFLTSFCFLPAMCCRLWRTCIWSVAPIPCIWFASWLCSWDLVGEDTVEVGFKLVVVSWSSWLRRSSWWWRWCLTSSSAPPGGGTGDRSWNGLQEFMHLVFNNLCMFVVNDVCLFIVLQWQKWFCYHTSPSTVRHSPTQETT